MVAARVGFASFVRQLRGRAGTARTILGRGPLSSRIRILPIAAACLLALSVHAQAEPAPPIKIPASDLVTALDSLPKQPGAQFIYLADQLRGARQRGGRGNLPATAARDELRAGTETVPRRGGDTDDGGAGEEWVIRV